MRHDEIALELVINAAAAAYGVSYTRLVGSRDQTEPVVTARRLAYWLARRMTMRSYPQIGAAFGRDHTSVLKGEQVAEAQRSTDPEFELVSNTVLSTLTTLERVGVMALARYADPVDIAQRILSDPQRQAVNLSVHEAVALALAVAANTSPATEEEAEYGQD